MFHCVPSDLPSADAHDSDAVPDQLSDSHRVGIAIGVIIERYGISCDEALKVLRDVSHALDRQQHDIAVEIIETGVIPWADDRHGLRYRDVAES